MCRKSINKYGILIIITVMIKVTISLKNQTIIEFVKEYFKEKNIEQVVCFECQDYDERVKFHSGLGIRVAYISILEDLDMQQIMKVNYYRIGVFLNLDCHNSNIILEQYNNNKIPFNESYFWLMVTKNGEKTLKHLRNLPLSVNTELTLGVEDPDTNNYILYDIYNPSYYHGGRLNVTYMGFWNNRAGYLKINLTQYKYARRQNFNGLALNFSIALNHEPRPDFYTYLTTPVEKQLDNMHRFNYNLLLQLRDYYNITMHLTRSSTWGYLINGSFNGILGDMVKGIVDVGVSPFMFKPERLDVCSYTVQAYKAKTTIIFRHPKKNSIRNNFLKPFDKKVWLLVVITVFVYWCLLYLTTRVEQHFDQIYRKKIPFPCVDSALSIVAVSSQQDCSNIPQLISGRIVLYSLFIWASLMYQFYSASIVGSLLAEPTRFINTLEDLIHSDLDVGMEKMGYNYDIFTTATIPIIKDLYNKKIGPNKKRKEENFFHADVGIRKIQEGGFAFHVDTAAAYKFIDENFSPEEICDLVEIPIVDVKHTATITVKNSPFRKMITYGLRQIIEHGSAERLKHVWLHKRPVCPESFSSKPVSVPLSEFTPLIFLLTMGSGLALFLLLVEKLMKKIGWIHQ